MSPDDSSRIWGLGDAAHTHNSVPLKNPTHTLAFLSGVITTNAIIPRACHSAGTIEGVTQAAGFREG